MPYVIMDYILFITLLAPDFLVVTFPLSRYAQIDMYILQIFQLFYMHFLIPPFPYFFSSAMTPNALLNPCYIWISFHHFLY